MCAHLSCPHVGVPPRSNMVSRQHCPIKGTRLQHIAATAPTPTTPHHSTPPPPSRPGYVRVSLAYFCSPAELQYVVDAVLFIADHGYKLLPQYTCDAGSDPISHPIRSDPIGSDNSISA